MIYRIAKAADLEACARFERTRSADDLLWHIEAELLFLAEREAVVIGYARLESFWKTMPYLALIVVREDCRGQGIGSGLLGFVCNELRGRGYTSLLSSSTANEPEPQHWHRRNGFVEIGLLAGINEGGIGEVFFRLPFDRGDPEE